MVPPFVDADWLNERRSEVVLVDMRWYLDGRSGGAAYAAGHLPGAIYMELDEVLAVQPSDRAGRHPLPSPEAFASGLGDLGIGDRDTVVAYDDDGGVIAARLVWMLRAVGQPAALLDGGIRTWRGPIQRGASPSRPRVHVDPRPWPDRLLATIDEVGTAESILIDGRDPERFAGGPDPVDPRSGHIPGARNLPAKGNVGPDGRLLSATQLVERFAAVGVDPDSQVISYCGSGVTACHNLLAMEQAGLRTGRLFPGSWSQWSRDPHRPVETGTPS